MQELYVYDLYGFRPEVKILSTVLYSYEIIYSFATGIYNGLRRMVVVTNYRALIIGSRMLGGSEIIKIPRKEVKSSSYTKKLIGSSIEFSTAENKYVFENVSRRVLELFEWALKQPVFEEK